MSNRKVWGKPEDLSGKKFGMLTVLNSGIKVELECEVRWANHCKCECGNTVDVISRYLKRGSKVNCGNSTCRKKWNAHINNPENHGVENYGSSENH